MKNDYSIGSSKWNGLSKLIEELGDVQASVAFFINRNFNVDEFNKIRERAHLKRTTYELWEKN